MSRPAPATEGDSALVVVVPECEPVVAHLRDRHDPVASMGVPAHVTVLYPFVPRRQIDDEVRGALTSLFGGLPAFAYRFESVGRLGPATIVLYPEPASSFRRLTESVHRHWPAHPPYGGVFDVVIPHLTVGDHLSDDAAREVEAAARDSLDRHGPVTGQATFVSLIVADDDWRWSTNSDYPLASAVS